MTQIALITGGGSGIGRSISKHLNRNNCIVYLVGRRLNMLEETKADSTIPENIRCIQGDLTVSSTIDVVYQKIASDVGKLDYLFNNAGMGLGGKITDLTSEQIEKQIYVNLTAPILLTRSLLPLLENAENPKIVNISSLSSKIYLPFHSVYSSSKSGLSVFSKTLRFDLGKKFNIYDVTPGLVRSEMASDAAINKMKELGIPASPLDTDQAVEHLFKQMNKGKQDIVIASPADKAMLKLNKLLPRVLNNKLEKEKNKIRELFLFANSH